MADGMALVRLVIRMNISLKRRGTLIVALWTLLVSLSGCEDRPSAAMSAPQSARSPAVPSPKVAPAGSKPQESASYRTSGPLVAEQQSDVAAEREGRVSSIAVQIGDHVVRGQLLAGLDDRSSRAAVESQAAKLASLQAQVVEWKAEERMDAADLRRSDQMRAERIVSQEVWEHVKYKLEEVTAEVARYQADERAAEADLQAAKLQLEQCRITAPFTGVVGRQSVRLAQEVKTGDVLFWVTAQAPLRVLFTIPESAMAAYSLGAPLDLTTAEYPGLHQAGHVLRVSPVVDPASDSVQVIGAISKPSPLLKPGMSMQVAVASGSPRLASVGTQR